MVQRILHTIPQHSINPSLASDLQDRLVEKALYLKVPSELKSAYKAFRHRDLRRYLLIGAPLLLLLTVSVIVFNTVLHWQKLVSEGSLPLWMSGSSFVIAAVAVGILGVMARKAMRYYSIVVGVPSTLVITKLATFPSLFENPMIGLTESYFCSLALIVVVLALRLSFRSILVILATSSSLVLVGDWLNSSYTLDYGNLFYYYFCVAAVCLFIAWQLEEREKTEFMQSVLIAYNSRVNEELRQKLSAQANRDPLTKLANRRAFDRLLATEWDRLKREQKPLSLLYIDIDHFKPYNDTYGHDQGDRCLIEVASHLRECLHRPADKAARLGGEEFVVLLPDTDLSGAETVAGEIMAQIDKAQIQHQASPTSEWLTLSIGVACAVPDTEGLAHDLVRSADQALYQAKSEGRHRVCLSRGPDRKTI